MAANYNLFSIDVLDKTESLIDTGGFTLKHFIIKEMPNTIPQVELSFATHTEFAFTDLKEIKVIISTDSSSSSYDVCITRIKITNKVEIHGLLCSHDDNTLVESTYLGDDLETAIINLDVRDNIVGIAKSPGGYWQFNETRNQCLTRLLRGARENSIFIMNNEYIKVIDLTSITTPQEYIAPTGTEYLDYDKNYPEDMFKEYLDDNSYGFNVTWMNQSFIGTNHYEFAHNYISSLRFSRPPDRMLKLIYKNIVFPYEVGSIMKISVPRFNVDSMQILSRIIQYKNEGIESDVLVGVQPT